MTAFATKPFDLPHPAPLRLGASAVAAKAWALDEAINENRKNTPNEVLEQRKEKRYSIAEINELDFDTISRRFAASRPRDNRPPTVKALDMIGLPRNVIANVGFGRVSAGQFAGGLAGTAGAFAAGGALIGGPVGAGIGAAVGAGIFGAGALGSYIAGQVAGVDDDFRDRATSNTEGSTFGIPRVMYSDVLRELGVKNRVARAILGFTGDVLFDPLTYIGGTGAGLRLVSATGKGLGFEISRTGRKVINASIKQASKGGGVKSITDDAAREYFRFKGIDDNTIRRFAQEAEEAGENIAKGVEGRIRSTTLGSIRHPRVAKILRPLGFDSRVGSSPLADDLARGVPEAQEFVARFQRGSTQLPGFSTKAARALGVGDELLHIPGTDIAFRVKPFTNAGRERVGIAALAAAGLAKPINTIALERAAKGVAEAEDGLESLTKILDESAVARRGLGPAALDIENISFDIPPLPRDRIQDNINRIRAIRDQVRQKTGGLVVDVQRIQDLIPTENMTPAALVATLRASDQYVKELELAESSLKVAQSNYNMATKLRTDRAEAVAASARDIVNSGRPVTDADVAELTRIRESFNTELDDITQRMLDLSPEEFAAASAHIDILKGRIIAVKAATEASLRPVYAALTSEERVIKALAERLLGTTSDIQGSQILAPMMNAIVNKFGEESKVVQLLHSAGRASRSAFGDTHGALWHEFRRFRATGGLREMEFIEQEGGRFRDLLRAAASEHLEPAVFNANFDAIDALVENLAVSKLWAEEAVGAATEGRASRGFRLYQFDPTDINGIRRGEDGKPMLSAWAEQIREASQSGVIGAKVNPGLWNVLNEHADALVTAYKTIGAAAGEDLDLVARAAYLPNHLVPELRRQVKNQAARGGDRGTVGRQSEAILEGFQKAKSSDQTVYRAADGSWRSFFEWQRMFVDDTKLWSDAAVEARWGVGSEEARFVTAVKKTINDYDALDNATKAKYPPRPTSSADLNRLVSEGHMELLTNRSKLKRSAFETGASRVWAARLAQQQRANARKGAVEMVSTHGFLVDNRLWGRTSGQVGDFVVPESQGSNITNPFGGVRGRIAPGGVLVIGEQRFRPLNREVINGDGKLLAAGLFDSDLVKGQTAFYPERIAEQIERVFEAYRAPGAMAQTLRAVDELTSVWKGGTLFHLSWMIGNAISSVVLAMSAGVRPDELVANFRTGMRASFSRGPKALTRRIRVGGEMMTIEDLLLETTLHGVWSTNRVNETALSLYANGVFRLNDPRFVTPGAIADRWTAAGITVAQSDRLSKFKGVSKITQTALFLGKQSAAAVGAWFNVNAKFEDAIRLTAYIALRNKGLSQNDAARRVITNLFDYQDLTNFERNVAKRMLPFYCVPDDTEALTRDGWKSVDDLKVGDEMLTYSVERDRLEWGPCREVCAFDHDQELEVFETKTIRLRYTKNHRWAVKRKDGERSIIPATELNTCHNIIVAAPIEAPESLLTPEQARLYGWLITDGYFRFRGNHCEAMLYQCPHKFYDETVAVAGGTPRKPHPDTGCVTIPVLKERVDEIKDILRHGKEYAPQVALRLSHEAAEAMFDAVLKADGSTCNGGTFIACQTPYKRETHTILATMLGYRVHQNSRGMNVHMGRENLGRTMRYASGTVSSEHYKGRVWCPRTDNHTWIMRQNGFVTITGNTWLKNSLVQQVGFTLEHPWYAGIAPKVKEMYEDMILGDAQLPEHERPQWLREQLAIQIGADPESRWAFTIGSLLPMEQMIRTAALVSGTEGAMDFANFFISSVNPIARVPIEAGFGREAFTDRTIGPSSTTGDISLMEHLANQIRPLRELGNPFSARKGAVPAAFGRSTAEGFGRAILGGRIQPFNDNRVAFNNSREIKEAEENIRRAIYIAIREGNASASANARLELLRLYDKALSMGMDNIVPKWAQNQLARMKGVSDAETSDPTDITNP